MVLAAINFPCGKLSVAVMFWIRVAVHKITRNALGGPSRSTATGLREFVVQKRLHLYRLFSTLPIYNSLDGIQNAVANHGLYQNYRRCPWTTARRIQAATVFAPCSSRATAGSVGEQARKTAGSYGEQATARKADQLVRDLNHILLAPFNELQNDLFSLIHYLQTIVGTNRSQS